MENPATWTPLHHEIHDAYYHSNCPKDAVLDVLTKNNFQVSLSDLEEVFSKFEKDLKDGVCGYSLPSTIITWLEKKFNIDIWI